MKKKEKKKKLIYFFWFLNHILFFIFFFFLLTSTFSSESYDFRWSARTVAISRYDEGLVLGGLGQSRQIEGSSVYRTNRVASARYVKFVPFVRVRSRRRSRRWRRRARSVRTLVNVLLYSSSSEYQLHKLDTGGGEMGDGGWRIESIMVMANDKNLLLLLHRNSVVVSSTIWYTYDVYFPNERYDIRRPFDFPLFLQG